MRKMMWFKIGDTRFHLLKLAGSFLIVTFMLKVMQAAYNVFLTMEKINAAEVNPTLIPQFFGWTMSATAYPSTPVAFTLQDIIGVLLTPTADFMLWLGMLVVALMVYQAGKFVFPIEEYERSIPENHKAAIVEAVRAHREKLAREAAAKSTPAKKSYYRR
ncbi:MAG: hypothetical protein WC408_02220 [Candidatus Micrarchaeia archaeon]|jgi:hypothetical protein